MSAAGIPLCEGWWERLWAPWQTRRVGGASALPRLWAEAAMCVRPRRDKRIAITGVWSFPTLVARKEVAMLPGHRRDLCEEKSPLTHTAFALLGLTARPMKHCALQRAHRPGRWAVVVAEAAARWRRVV